MIGNATPTAQRVVGFTQPELSKAFELVETKGDWKGPVDGVVPEDQLALVLLAVEFFTATRATVLSIPYEPSHGQPQYRVRAAGYRMGPAGP